MQVQITPQAKAQHHGPVNRNKYRGDPWESGINNQQVTKYEGQKGSPGSSMDIAHPSTITRQGNDWHTMYKAKHWLRDYGKAIKCTYSGIEDTKQNVPVLQGWDRNQVGSIKIGITEIAHLTYQKGVKRNRRRTQRKNYHMQAKMVRMKKTSSKRGP
jgi:hypothetical protein